MDRLDMQTKDLVQENITKIEQLFPNCVTEYADDDGKIVKKVDMEMLARELQYEPVAEGTERYSFNWPYKFKTIREMKSRQKKMLRPIKEKSVDFDNTKNLYIEGDNLDAMLVLRSHYLNKIKLIYIDPPYNTGEDFVYRDNFTISPEEYKSMSGEYDEEGNKVSINDGSDGRLHTDWLNMLYSRLTLAKDLLTPDGVIFISIDDNELGNMLKLCDDVFGHSNFESVIAWRRRTNQPNDKSKMIAKVSENIVVYAKNSKTLAERKAFNGVPLSPERCAEYKNPDNDPRGPWSSNPWKAAVGRGGTRYSITTPTGKEYTETWYGNKDTFESLLKDNRVHWTSGGDGVPRIKIYLSEAKKEGQAAINFFTPDKYGSNQEGSSELEELFGQKGIFSNPKPVRLIESIIQLATFENDTILDFFSGSATTAHAVMKINAESGSKRTFIMVQYPEKIKESEPSYVAGYRTICDIGEERIRRAGKAIQQKYPLQVPDIGFRVLKVDETCVQEVFYEPKNLTRSDLKRTVSYFKPLTERSLLDRLFQALPEFDLPFSVEFTEENINGKNVFIVNKGFLIACLETGVKVDTIRAIANMHPDNALFCNDSMDDDSTAINCDQIFNQLSPETHLRII